MIAFKLDKESPVPFYRQIVDLVLAGISGGRVLPGDRLPTIRDLAVQLEVNPNTVVKAYTQLQILEVLDTQQGSGVFVHPTSQRAATEGQNKKAAEELCQDFVARAQLLNINLDDLIACLKDMKPTRAKEKS
jgi:GntR family transcriptional regulator